MYLTTKEKQKQYHRRSFFKFFRFQQCLIPFSTLNVSYTTGTEYFDYQEIYMFGFRVARLHKNH